MNSNVLRTQSSGASEHQSRHRRGSRGALGRYGLSLLIAALCVLSTLPARAGWRLDSAHSSLSFASTKNLTVGEGHAFVRLDGNVDASGQARLVVDLASVDTGIDIRNERMKELLFEIARFPQAVARAQIPLAELSALPIGASVLLPLEVQLRLHGQEAALSSSVRVRRLAADRIEVSSVRPILVNAASFDLLAGLDKLRELAGLQNISPAVPVWLLLEFQSE